MLSNSVSAPLGGCARLLGAMLTSGGLAALPGFGNGPGVGALLLLLLGVAA